VKSTSKIWKTQAENILQWKRREIYIEQFSNKKELIRIIRSVPNASNLIFSNFNNDRIIEGNEIEPICKPILEILLS
jgi:hypothetical protein